MVVAAAPTWFADNIPLIVAALLIIGAIVVVRMVHERVTKTLLLALIAAVAVFVYVNREPLQACAETCECQIADQDVSVPLCDSNLELSASFTPGPRPV